MAINALPFAAPGLPEPVQAPLGSWPRRLLQQLNAFHQLVALQFGVLRSDVVGLDNAISALQVGAQEVQARLEEVRTLIDGIDSKLDEIAENLTAMQTKNAEQDQQLIDMEFSQAALTARVVSLEARVTALEP